MILGCAEKKKTPSDESSSGRLIKNLPLRCQRKNKTNIFGVYLLPNNAHNEETTFFSFFFLTQPQKCCLSPPCHLLHQHSRVLLLLFFFSLGGCVKTGVTLRFLGEKKKTTTQQWFDLHKHFTALYEANTTHAHSAIAQAQSAVEADWSAAAEWRHWNVDGCLQSSSACSCMRTAVPSICTLALMSLHFPLCGCQCKHHPPLPPTHTHPSTSCTGHFQHTQTQTCLYRHT